ncbi:hypothetical protein SynBOUM118_00448 [Synechococcus sp. BOUM118]|nr:hypothetical protein SynBOUM118_00448 [Synechococcus sp. BOUM118]
MCLLEVANRFICGRTVLVLRKGESRSTVVRRFQQLQSDRF